MSMCIKSNDLKTRQFQRPLPVITQSPFEIASCARSLFAEYDWRRDVRAVSVRVIGLVPEGKPFQTDLFTDLSRFDKQKSIDDTVDALRNRFGKKIVTAASLMGDIKVPSHSDRESILPGMMHK